MKISELVSEGALGSFTSNFVKSASGGRIDPTDPSYSLGATLASMAGLQGTAAAMQDKNYQKNTAQQLSQPAGTTPKVNPNQTIDMPPLGKVKVKPTASGGIEIDTRNTDLARQGIPKLNIDKQTLQQMTRGAQR
jgi:hypothetical protein